MKEEIKIAFTNISIAVSEFKGTKQEHVMLEQYLQLIKKELESCTCKRENNLKELIKKD